VLSGAGCIGWAQAEANITQSNMTPEQATEEAAKRIKQLFERYQRRRPRWRGQGCVPSAPVVATRDEA
jgi:hypothetical protein